MPPLPQVEVKNFEAAVRQAIQTAARKAQAAPEDAQAVKEFGMALQAHDQFASAVVAYRRALAIDPANPETMYFLGVALAADGQYSQAIPPLRKAMAAKADAVAVRLKLADSLLALGETVLAQKEYLGLLARDSALAQAHFGLGRTLQDEKAVEEFTKALELFPRYGAAQFALAASYRRTGKNAEAKTLLVNYEKDKLAAPPVEDPAMDKVYALNTSSTGLLRKAQVLDREGHLAEALAFHEQVIQADPNLDQAWVNLISLYGRTQQPERAEQAYKRAIALAPNRADAYYNFGVLCFAMERWAEAGQVFQKSLELDPLNAEAAHNLGVVVERDGKLNQAAALYQKAIAIKPDHRLAHFHLGRIYANQRRFDQAVAEFEQTIEPLDEQSPTYLYALGATQARAGRKQLAYELLNRAKVEAARFGQDPLMKSIERDVETLMRGRK